MTSPNEQPSTSGGNPETYDTPHMEAASKAERNRGRESSDPGEAARELPTAGPLAFNQVLGDDIFGTWVDQVKGDDRYKMRDPDNPQDGGTTNAAGGTPPPALIVPYGDGPHDYVSTVIDAGQAIVQDGNDPTGRAWKFPERAWRRFVARVRGEELPESEREDGPSMFAAAAEQNARTGKLLQADRDANERAAQRADKGVAE